MQICGIVAEFNPFHNGHQYIINKIKASDNCILSVMSGNYVQRGEPAQFSKFLRAKSALECGVDLVVELPSPWSSSCAQNFSYGAISILKNCGISKLYFGSEIGNVEVLRNIAQVDRHLKLSESQLKSGKTFAQLRQTALSEILGTNCDTVLKGANNNLGIEYLKAMLDLECDFETQTIARCGTNHDSNLTSGDICSASYLRDLIETNRNIDDFVPRNVIDLYNEAINEGKHTDFTFYRRTAFSFLRRFKNFEFLPDISEGIEMKLLKELRNANSFEELMDRVKSKRYTLARIRRLLLSAYLKLDSEWFLKEVPYINVLGFSPKGEAALKQIAEVSKVPIVVSCKPNRPLTSEAQKLLDEECIRNDLYMSLLVSPMPCGCDHTNGLIKQEYK